MDVNDAVAITSKLFEAFHRFIKEGTPETFSVLRTVFVRWPGYCPYSRQLEKVTQQFGKQSDEQTLLELNQIKVAYLICPDFHGAMSSILAKFGRRDEADAERYLAYRCCQGLFSTGDGTEQRPFFPAFVQDEYAVISALGKTLAGQTLHKRAGRSFDVIKCGVEDPLWFDVTDLLAVLDENKSSIPQLRQGVVEKISDKIASFLGKRD